MLQHKLSLHITYYVSDHMISRSKMFHTSQCVPKSKTLVKSTIISLLIMSLSNFCQSGFYITQVLWWKLKKLITAALPSAETNENHPWVVPRPYSAYSDSSLSLDSLVTRSYYSYISYFSAVVSKYGIITTFNHFLPAQLINLPHK